MRHEGKHKRHNFALLAVRPSSSCPPRLLPRPRAASDRPGEVTNEVSSPCDKYGAAAAGKDDRGGGGADSRHNNTQAAFRAGNLLFWSDSFRLPDLREGGKRKEKRTTKWRRRTMREANNLQNESTAVAAAEFARELH